ncbi:lung seven transmembrane receptor-domain-containing protein [Phellopilus nigrolimitatus]|nr:lung seven transmembrane receptor-domain-containing protein [Phellopilus nigrolimitatus]
MTRSRKILPWLLAGLCGAGAAAYEVPFVDTDYSSQVCSGMWGGARAHINVTFDATSQGQLAMVIYEWKDNEMLGKVTSMIDDTLPQKTYVCTSDAVRGGFCDSSGLGKFIIDLPDGKSLNETSFWTARVGFRSRNATSSKLVRQDGDSSQSTSDVLWYDQPIQYQVRNTGYYCVAIVPVTVLTDESSAAGKRAPSDVPFHPSYSGVILFQNTFNGELPASDYPKVNFYFSLFVVYAALAGAWGWLCYKYREELLPIQYYLSSLVGLLVIEMVANWAYYRYLNARGWGTTSTVFLFVVAILDAGRNALSFFLLLVVSLGLSVVRESLGRTMTKCQILAVAHFIFGVLYSVGIVELELESTSALILLLFVIPLAFTLSGFLLWIIYALNGTISHLAARKQSYKLSMFRRLHRILCVAMLVIAIFFVVSSLSFSNRLAEDFAANTWKSRWWLLDGWLSLLYLVVFVAICYLWRPTLHNRRLAMSDELAQEDEDAEDYDLEALESRTRNRDDDDDDDATLVGGRRGPASIVAEDVVFEIGDQDMSDDDEPKTADKRLPSQHHEDDRQHGDDVERQGLMNGDGRRDRND